MEQGMQKVGKKKGKDWLISIICIVIFAAAVLYLYNQNATAPVISIEGVEFKLKGSTSVLAGAGFDITGGSSLEGRTWNHGFGLKKDGKIYASLTLYNTSNDTKPTTECGIGEITVYTSYFLDKEAFLIDGIAPFATDADELREAFKIEEEDTIVSTDLGYVHVQFSDYNSETNRYERVSLSCDFNQSYE